MGFLDKLFGIDDARKRIQEAEQKSTKSLQSSYDDVQGMYSPYVDAGRTSLSSMMDLSGLSGPGSASLAYDEFRASPIYRTGMDEGIAAIDRSAAGRSGLNSGNTMRDLSRFASDYNNKSFGDYYNRIAGIGNTGYSATGATAGARQNLGQGTAGIQMQTGQELANADLASGSFLQKLISSGIGAAGYAMGGGFGSGGGFGVPAAKKQSPLFFNDANGVIYRW